ncbi:site-specific integrase [Pseudomonas sp. PDM32]|uniref:tyrosine-type recombinase/integrase n=1 Tax=Pseudomonas sp. PDM32 TaxID=2854768 RepID=UPI001C4698B6|nr:tyrosine-type recombinase/integrase [Pseudomonas sp. PDM32]MBV7575924.1 site-specific integrase [Pseudomonas sp. PDM32]
MSVIKLPKQVEVRDQAYKCLIVVKYPKSGNSTYYVRAQAYGRRRIKLGTSKELTLQDARIKAIEMMSSGCQAIVTVDKAFEAYEKTGNYSGKRSMSRERKRYDSVVAPILDGKDIKGIKLSHIQEVMDSLRPTLSDATKNRYLSMLRSFFRFSVDIGYCDKDPTRKLKLKRELPAKLYEVNADLINRLNYAVKWLEPRYPLTSCLVEFLLLTGMRLGEALSLKWTDFDQTLCRVTLRITKTGRMRHVPISEKCFDVLECLALATGDFPDDGWVFPSSYNNCHMTRPVRPWKEACKAAGLPKSFRFHDLRHVFASACVKTGIPLYTVQGLLGHSSIRMTEKYSSLASSDLLKASQSVSCFLGSDQEVSA